MRAKAFAALLALSASTAALAQSAPTIPSTPTRDNDEDVDDRLIDAGGSASKLIASDTGLFYGFSTINGREVSGAGNVRVMDFKAFPSRVTKDELSYRFARADDIEGALFGTLKTHTVKSLDLDRRHVDVELRGLYYPYADRAHQSLGRRVSADYIDQFDTGIGQIGISLGLLIRRLPQPREYYEAGTNYVPCNSVAAAGDCSYDAKSGRPLYYAAPSGTFRQERVTEKLNGYSGAIQWQPGDRWDINLDVEHSRRVTTRYRNELGISDTLSGVTPLAIGTNGELLRWSGSSGLDLNAFRRQRDERYTGGGLTLKYQASDRLTVTGDGSYSRTFRIQNDTSATLQANDMIGPGGQVGYVADQSRGGIPSYTFSQPVDLNDYAAFTLNPADRRGHEVRTDQIWAGRVDATYALDGFLTAIKAGLRYSVHTRDAELHTYIASGKVIDPANAAAGMAQCRIPTIISNFADQTITNIHSWAMFDPVCLFDAFAGTADPNAMVGTLSGGGIHVREQVAAGYVMATFKGKFAAIPVDGNFGVRLVETDTHTRVYRFTADPADLIGVGDTVGPVVDALPSLNVRLKPNDRWTVNGGVARALLRSNIEGLGLRRILQGPAGQSDTGRQRPLRSWNIDLVFRYRPVRATTLSLALSDKILSSSAWPGDTLIPGGPLLPSWLAGESRRGAYIRSVEMGIDQRLAMLPHPLDAIRIKASYIYTGSNFRFADPTAFDKSNPLYLYTAPAGVPAVSRHAPAIARITRVGRLRRGSPRGVVTRRMAFRVPGRKGDRPPDEANRCAVFRIGYRPALSQRKSGAVDKACGMVMQANSVASHPELRHFVSRYTGRSADFGSDMVRIALPARTATFLEFYFTQPMTLEIQRTGLRESAPWGVAVGPQTFRRIDLLPSGRLESFNIGFTPTGLYRFFGIPMTELTDEGIDASHLLGIDGARDLHDALASVPSVTERARIADRALLGLLGQRDAVPGAGLVTSAVERMQRSSGAIPITALIPSGTLSQRQFRRLFEVQVGMSPKRYARIIRLGAAIEAKMLSPARSWTDIAHSFGWYDQAHLDKDFHEMAGAAPSSYPIGPRLEV